MLIGFGDDDLLVSYDDGSSWDILTSNLPLGLRPWQQKGFCLNDRLLVWDAYHITQFKTSDTGLDYVSFCTEGLDPAPGKYIHRMVIGEEYIFAGTQQGLFYKPLNDFWESALENDAALIYESAQKIRILLSTVLLFFKPKRFIKLCFFYS